MSGNVRHALDSKMRAATLFDQGFGYKMAARLVGAPKDTVRQWLYIYRAFGTERLRNMGANHNRYDYETKVAAASAVVDRGLAKAEAMAAFGITSLASLEKWCRTYRKGGAEALKPKPKGRPRGSKDAPKAPMTREQELEARVRKLEAENAYLKKLEALRVEEELRTGSRPRW